MYTPFVCLRITAYHMVIASLVPWIRSHGRGGTSPGSEILAATSCLWVAT